MPLSRPLRLTLLVVANLLIPLACFVFAKGFFPYKPLLPGSASFDLQDAEEEMGLLSAVEMGKRVPVARPERKFDKVIFMVVDALRSDFVFGSNSGFDFTQSLIRDGHALPFTAHAAPPTVTMPRVKALTTGSVPSFVDLILNFAESDTSSSLASQDTWLSQIKLHIRGDDGAASGRLYFYGDDTWLKLFPDFFDVHDGTSSFFVSDFTEVDNNVTRHVAPTLRMQDWDAMIMHYLGLDHIGHKTGPEGPNMLPKQREMDGIVRDIYTAIETLPHLENTLLVLAGDHGMNSAGNHGGSAEGETSTALVLASPKLKTPANGTRYDVPAEPRPGGEFEYYSKIKQSDLVPTISALLGIPIPKNNLGVVPPSVLELWAGSDEDGIKDPVVQLLYRNSLQILNIVTAQYGRSGFFESAGRTMSFRKCKVGYSGKYQLQCLWSRAQRMLLVSSLDARFSEVELIESLKDFLQEAQDQLSTAASTYDVGLLALGVGLALLASIAAVYSTTAFAHVNPATLAFGAITLLYSVMMFATSFVEEEQHIWYWATSAWLAFMAVAASARAKIATQGTLKTLAVAFLPLALHRLANRWNQTGQKHAGEADIVKSFFPEHTYVLWSMVIATYLLFSIEVGRRSLKGVLPMVPGSIIGLAATIPAVIFKMNFTKADAPELVGDIFSLVHESTTTLSLVDQAQLVFQSLAALSVVVVTGHFLAASRTADLHDRTYLVERLQPLLALFLLTQSRVANSPLFLLYWIQAKSLSRALNKHVPTTAVVKSSSALRTSVTILLLTYASFYQLGGSNGISSIDLSNAYNGVSSYNIVAVGVLLFTGNWAGPIWWTFKGAEWLLRLNAASEPVTETPGTSTLVKQDPQTEANESLTPSNKPGKPIKTPSTQSPISTPSKPTTNTNPALTRLSESEQASTPRSPNPARPRSTDTASLVAKSREHSAYDIHASATTLFTAASLTATMAACTILRTHLFIWTVFSPKFLFAMAWAVGWHLVVNLLVGGVGFDLG